MDGGTPGVVLILFGVVMVLVPLVWPPRQQWRTLYSWSYRHPEANEPSDAAYRFSTVASVVIGVVLIGSGFLIMALTTSTADAQHEDRERDAERRGECEAGRRLDPNEGASDFSTSGSCYWDDD